MKENESFGYSGILKKPIRFIISSGSEEDALKKIIEIGETLRGDNFPHISQCIRLEDGRIAVSGIIFTANPPSLKLKINK